MKQQLNVALLVADTSIPKLEFVFGHQIIAKALGGKTLKNQLGWEVTVTNKTNKKVLMYQIQGMFKEEHVLTVQAHPEFVSGKGEGNN
ncbi:5664_t:CDS:2 [Entrophospora sp. SA101]|nr:5664_t:CDS:2 [Entrophospora sp. SA101]CAJ0893864.1 1598_t:CDS:2 [Entrophospora sp. SA101]